MQGPDEQGCRDANRCSKQDIEHQHRSALRIGRQWCEVGGDIEGGPVAEEYAADEGRHAGGDRHRKKRVDADFRQHQFDGKEHAADRRVECRSNASTGSTGDEDDSLSHGHADHLPEGRTERGADLNDRTFATNRCTRADRQGGCERLGHRDHGADDAATVVDRVHHLGDAVTLRLGCEIADDEGDADCTDDWDQNDQRTPGRRRGEQA